MEALRRTACSFTHLITAVLHAKQSKSFEAVAATIVVGTTHCLVDV